MYRSQREDAASKKYYKQGLDADEMKKRREDQNFSVRKNKRNEQMKKKRQLGGHPPSLPQGSGVDNSRMSPEDVAEQVCK